MPTARTIPLLPCRDVDEMLTFYVALGFAKTYGQLRPSPYVCVAGHGIDLHFFGMPAFDPAASYGSCLVQTDDADALYRAFADGLRAHLGKLPAAGIPRLTRPQRRDDRVRSFSLIDPGGNWIRVSQSKSPSDIEPEPAEGLAKMLEAAMTLGESKGDPAAAAKLLDGALSRHADAELAVRAEALAYRAELAIALGEREGRAEPDGGPPE